MNKKLPYLIALSAFAVCLPAASQAQIAKGAACAIKGGKSAVKLAQGSIKTPAVPGLKLRVERAIAEQKIDIRGGVENQRTPREAAQRALDMAIYRHESDLIKPLLAKGAYVNHVYEDGWTLLTKAVKNGDKKSAHTLLANGADVNLPNHRGETPLILAAGNFDMTELLLNNSAKVDLQDQQGNTALMRAHDKKTMTLLLDNGADPNHQNNEGWTGLMYIAGAGYEADAETIKGVVDRATLLIQRGADVNIQASSSKTTALHRAVGLFVVEMTKLLLENGADPYLLDSRGEDVFHKASWAAVYRNKWDLYDLVHQYEK